MMQKRKVSLMSERRKIARGMGIVFAGSVLAYPVYPKVYKV